MSTPQHNLVDRVKILEGEIARMRLLLDDLSDAIVNTVTSHKDKKCK